MTCRDPPHTRACERVRFVFGFERKHRTHHCVERNRSKAGMTIDEYEQLTPEEKEHFAKAQSAARYLIGGIWTNTLPPYRPEASAGHSVFRIDNDVSCAFVPPDARLSLQAQAPRGKETRPFQAPWSQNCIDTI
jgi:hypothetical protein